MQNNTLYIENSAIYAAEQDEKDPLKKYRQQFYIPQVNGKDSIYFCGNSLGLQPKSVRKHIEQELKDWQNLGVEGHFDGKNAWYYYHHFLSEATARLVGAKPSEVVIMNALSVNLHLMMVSFYRPTTQRYKILIEEGAFPSDIYAVKSQAQHHGFEADDAIVVMTARKGEHTLRTEDIVAKIADEIVGFGYYSEFRFREAYKFTVEHSVYAKKNFIGNGIGNL